MELMNTVFNIVTVCVCEETDLKRIIRATFCRLTYISDLTKLGLWSRPLWPIIINKLLNFMTKYVMI